jgi:uncharacterized protein
MMSRIVNNNGVNSQEKMTVLAVSDVVVPQLYNCGVKDWLPPVDLIVSCGDLPPHYLDFLVTMLNVPLVHVVGNHCYVSHDSVTQRCAPDAYQGAFNLNGRVAEYKGLVLAGIEGSPLYNYGPHQYTDQQMLLKILRMAPALLREKVHTGRYLDMLVTHAPPRGIHDNADIAHTGFESLLGFIERFKPALMLHGHTHRYDPTLPTYTRYMDTDIINIYGHSLLEIVRDGEQSGWRLAGAVESPRPVAERRAV